MVLLGSIHESAFNLVMCENMMTECPTSLTNRPIQRKFHFFLKRWLSFYCLEFRNFSRENNKVYNMNWLFMALLYNYYEGIREMESWKKKKILFMISSTWLITSQGDLRFYFNC